MLLFAVKYRRAGDTITTEKTLKLRKFELDEQERKILGDLLTVFKFVWGQVLHPAVHAATEFTKNCLNKYWFNADDLDVYRIAMILHPGMKLKYFKEAAWASKDYIEDAKSLAVAAFGAY
ncbi:hypothetical protein B0H14DRAFT_2598502 [Mycena olivaceomarginata]|nr:hypothetical protein B0H14DRAFT_2598502 [Mycena olivaceomarginata]